MAPPVGGGTLRRYGPLAALVVGTTLGGILLGGTIVVAWFGLAPLDSLRTAILLGGGAVGAIAVLWKGLRRWLPERPCQVADRHMLDPPGRAAFRWGVELGTGIRTFVVTPAIYALLAVALAQGEPLAAGALCGLYGASRGATIAWFALAHTRLEPSEEAVLGVGLERTLRRPVVLAITTAVAFALA